MDIYYYCAIGVFVLSLIIQASLKSTFNKYSKVRSTGRYTAEEAAAIILREAEVNGLVIKPISGSLTDNYNPKAGTINLSQTVYGQRSIAAIAVAAHECGHAIQDSRNFWIYRIRQFLAPVAGFASRAGVYVAMIGVLLSAYAANAEDLSLYSIGYYVITAGIVAYTVAFLFYLVMVSVH